MKILFPNSCSKAARVGLPFFFLLALLAGAPNAVWGQQIDYSARSMKKNKGTPYIRLRENVRFTQRDMVVRTAEADFDQANNLFKAYGNVHVTKGREMEIFSDRLNYYGNKHKGEFRDNVLLIDDGDTLRTDFLDFNSLENSGYFFNGGQIVDSAATLESKNGYYYPDRDSYFFKDSVRVYNEQYTLYSDTLKYNLLTEKAIVLGPTEIIGDSSYVYCERGWYDMARNVVSISQEAFLLRNTQKLTADSLFFRQEEGTGEAFRNVRLVDTVRQAILEGQYAFYREKPAFALMTDSALFTDASTPGDSLFLHADTLVAEEDTTGQHRIVRAFYNARTFKSDFQARSDSMSYTTADSVLRMFGSPILWSGDNQVTGGYLEVHTEDNSPRKLVITENPMIAGRDAPEQYNQIVGDTLLGYFRDGDLYRLDAIGHARALYYVRNEDELIGLNSSECKQMSIFMQESAVKRVIFHAQPKGKLYPMRQTDRSLRFMENFKWHEKLRPKNKFELFCPPRK